MNRGIPGTMRIYVSFSEEEYQGLSGLAAVEGRDLRDQIRACVRSEVDRVQRAHWLAALADVRREIVGQAEKLDEVFAEICVLDDVATALDLRPAERRQVLGDRVAAWLDAPAAEATEAGVIFVNGNGGGPYMAANGHGPGGMGNGQKTALAGNGKATRQGC